MAKKTAALIVLAMMALQVGSANDFIIKDSNENLLFSVNSTGKTSIHDGNLDMNNNKIENSTIPWTSLNNYPSGCNADEAVQVVDDTIQCTTLNPGGTVETSGGSEGEVAFFLDSENITGGNNLYWNSSERRLGIGTSTPTSAIDLESGNLDMSDNDIVNYFGSDCGTNKAVKGVYDNGSYNCGQAGGGLTTVLGIDNSAGIYDMDMNGNRVQNIISTQPGDAVNQSYVNNQIGSQNLKTVLQKGNTAGNQNINMTGNNITQLNAIQNNEAVTTLDLKQNNDVEIPNGDLSVSGDISAGGTECSEGEFLDGDGSCTSVTGTTDGLYVNENGDDMTGALNMSGNSIESVGAGKIDLGDGEGHVDMNNQRIKNSGIIHASNIGIADSVSAVETEVDGNDLYVQDDVAVDGNIVGAGADVAEKIKSESKVEEGTVVEISGNMTVDRTDKIHDTDVAGVVSTDPAVVMAKERDGVPIAMTGTVPVKISMENGEITPGDLLTTASKHGYAMKCRSVSKCTGSIIGKAMQPQREQGKVRMLISRG